MTNKIELSELSENPSSEQSAPRAVQHYSSTAISLHWLMALLIFAGWGLGIYMHDLPLSPAKLRYFSWHKWLGVTVFFLAIIRIGWPEWL